MNEADWTIIGVVVVSGLISLKRGFVKEALSLVTWIVAIIIAVVFKEQLALLLTDYITTPSLRDVAAIAILFISTLLVGGLLNFMISQLIEATGLSGTDRFLGLLFGALRGIAVVLAALLFVPKFLPVSEDVWWQQSVLIPEILKLESIYVEIMNLIKDLYASILG